MNYSVTNDKRKGVECVLYIIACLVCAILEIFVFAKIVITNEAWNMVFTIFKIVFSLSPVGLVWIAKKCLKKQLLYLAGVPIIEGTHDVELHSNYQDGLVLNAKIEKKQTFDSILLYFKTDKSESTPDSCHIDNAKKYSKLIYTYHNDGDGADKDNKTHMGTAVLTFINGKIKGFYYNNGKDRQTYGRIAS